MEDKDKRKVETVYFNLALGLLKVPQYKLTILDPANEFVQRQKNVTITSERYVTDIEL